MGHTYAIVLAGGEGRRLEPLARQHYGYARPKQFCDFGGGGTLLGRTIERIRPIVEDEHIVVVTSRHHRAEADEVLRAFPRVRRVEQPRGRDTTPGLLLPLFHVLDADPQARVVTLPSDHEVADAPTFVRCLERALASIPRQPQDVLLLGAKLPAVEEGYGWIRSEPAGSGQWGRVRSFHEKPSAEDVARLVADGALANTFVMAGAAFALAKLALEHAPAWFEALRRAVGSGRDVERAYQELPPSNFSVDVLERAASRLRVVPLPPVGWTDLGTPERLRRVFGARVAAPAASEWGAPAH